MLTAIISFIVVLGSLIVVHEFGHFLVAKWSGVGVLKFSVGFGPTLFGRTVNGTEYVLSAIPLGGFVKMVGEDPDATEPVDPRISFSHQNVWKRIAIVIAGPVFNLIFAFVIFSTLTVLYGEPVAVVQARIAGVTADGPAARAGLQPNDLVVAVDGKPVNWDQLSTAIRSSEGHTLTLDVKRGDGSVQLTVTPEARPEKSIFGEVIGTSYLIGVERAIETVEVGPLEAIASGAQQTVFTTQALITGIVKMIQGRIPATELGGPIMIAKAAAEQAHVGLDALLRLIAVISINLGVLNLLPIPILDGGHLLFFVVEIVMRRPLDLRHREIAQQVGLVILVSLMAFAFYNDILRSIRGWG